MTRDQQQGLMCLIGLLCIAVGAGLAWGLPVALAAVGAALIMVGRN